MLNELKKMQITYWSSERLKFSSSADFINAPKLQKNNNFSHFDV